MDFEDTPQEAAFRSRARDWINANAPTHLLPELKRAGFTSIGVTSVDPMTAAREWQARKLEGGWAVPQWPKEYGGGALSPIERVIWNETEGPYAALSSPFTIGIGMCGPTLMSFASEEQKQRYLPRIASGEDIWCQMFSEPAAGSDLAGLRMRAVPADDGSGDWIVNGQKTWTSMAHDAAYGILLTRTDPNVPKHKGLTMFFVDMNSPGIEVRSIKQANGGRRFNEVFFTDVRIPDTNRLGEVGAGWKVSLTTLMHERQSVGSRVPTGFDDLFAFCLNAQIDGRPAVEDSRVRARLADFAVKHTGLKYTSLRTIAAVSKGELPGPENSIGKLVAARTMQDIAMFALDLQAQAGIAMDEEQSLQATFTQILLRSPATRIEAGSDEILRNIIGERVLGLPADIRVDKNVPFKDIPVSADA